jgi:nicotinate phosphoribosyltransferase
MEVRKILDAAGFPNAQITVSNDLDESIIQTLTNAGAPINSWGVGTQMVTGGTEAAFSGVYKLAAREDSTGALVPAIKFSDNPDKTTNPGIKQVWRIKDQNGMAVADVLSLEQLASENKANGSGPDGGAAAAIGNADCTEPDILEKGKRYSFWHPSADYRHFYHEITGTAECLLKLRMNKGTIKGAPSLAEIKAHVAEDLDSLDNSYKRLLNPHVYKVSVTTRLRDLKLELIKTYLGDL